MAGARTDDRQGADFCRAAAHSSGAEEDATRSGIAVAANSILVLMLIAVMTIGLVMVFGSDIRGLISSRSSLFCATPPHRVWISRVTGFAPYFDRALTQDGPGL
jgi:hypothetical protein